jgi:tRNA-dihydrouridine synthase
MIGHDIPALVRTARELQGYPVAGVDLNLGCPAPTVYRKFAGGGLLREPDRVDAILGALRQAVVIPFTVKTRLGFDSPGAFAALLAIFARHSLDLVTVHGRTVREMYQGEVHYDLIRQAVESLPCPVLANGNVRSALHAEEVLQRTGARGLMIGRGAIRNPWIFQQIRQLRRGEHPFQPIGRDVLEHIERLYDAVCSPDAREAAQVKRMKKFLNYIGAGIDSEGRFLHQIRRVATRAELFRVCAAFLDHDRPMALEPFGTDSCS